MSTEKPPPGRTMSRLAKPQATQRLRRFSVDRTPASGGCSPASPVAEPADALELFASEGGKQPPTRPRRGSRWRP